MLDRAGSPVRYAPEKTFDGNFSAVGRGSQANFLPASPARRIKSKSIGKGIVAGSTHHPISGTMARRKS